MRGGNNYGIAVLYNVIGPALSGGPKVGPVLVRIVLDR